MYSAALCHWFKSLVELVHGCKNVFLCFFYSCHVLTVCFFKRFKKFLNGFYYKNVTTVVTESSILVIFCIVFYVS